MSKDNELQLVRATHPETSRYWVFTINNPKESDYLFVEELYNSGHARYVVFGEENFDIIDKTPHLQGYAEFNKSVRFNSLRARLPRAYIGRKRGTRSQARDYCLKDCVNFREYGTWVANRSGERTDLEAVRKRIREGTPMETIADEHFGLWLRYRNAFTLYGAQIAKKKRRLDIINGTSERIKTYWFYGETGTGKSHAARHKLALMGDFFEKSPGNKWFDGYAGEKYALFDDFRPSWFEWSLLLRITDPCAGYTNVEAKGSILPFNAKVLVFTTNVHPSELFCNLAEDKEQLLRRIDCTEFKIKYVEG